MKKILLISFFNSNNIGDRAISKTFFDLLSERFDVTKCSVEGNFDIFDRYVGEKIGAPQRVKHKLCELFGRRYTTPRYRRFLTACRERIGEFDAVVIGGGNIMMDYTERSSSYEKYSDYVSIAKESGVPTFVFSAGIGPFRTGGQAKGAVGVLNGCEYVSFRDESSLALFVENGGNAAIAALSRDPVFLLEKRPGKEKKDVIAVNVIDPRWDGGVGREALAEAYAKLTAALAEAFPEKRIVLFSTEKNDAALAENIAERSSGAANYAGIGSLDGLLEFYSGCSLLVGARMHSMIIAFTQRVPVIALSWSRKIDEFASIAGAAAFALSDLSSDIPAVVAEAKKNADRLPETDGVVNDARRAVMRDIGALG